MVLFLHSPFCLPCWSLYLRPAVFLLWELTRRKFHLSVDRSLNDVSFSFLSCEFASDIYLWCGDQLFGVFLQSHFLYSVVYERHNAIIPSFKCKCLGFHAHVRELLTNRCCWQLSHGATQSELAAAVVSSLSDSECDLSVSSHLESAIFITYCHFVL